MILTGWYILTINSEVCLYWIYGSRRTDLQEKYIFMLHKKCTVVFGSNVNTRSSLFIFLSFYENVFLFVVSRFFYTQGIGIKWNEMALVWHEEASCTALQTCSVFLTHALLVQTHNMIWSRKLQNSMSSIIIKLE